MFVSTARYANVAVGVIFLAVATFFGIAQHGIFADDVYITFRYSQNFAEGHGLVYNAGQHYLGTSGPGYAILLGLIAKIFGSSEIPMIAEVVSTLSIFAIAYAIFVGFAAENEPVVGFIGGAIAIAMPLVRNAYGFEILPQMACVAWAYVLLLRDVEARRSALLSAVLLALAIVLRPDGVLWFFGPLLLCWVFAFRKGTQRRWKDAIKAFPIRESALALAVVIFGLLCVKLVSGQFLPSTFAAKVAQLDSTDWQGFLAGGTAWITNELIPTNDKLGLIFWLAVLGLFGTGFLVIQKRNRILALWLFGISLHFYVYATRLPYYGWYYVPEGIGISILTGVSIRLLDSTSRRIYRPTRWIVVAGSAILLFEFLQTTLDVTRVQTRALANAEKVKLYTNFGKWLRENTAPTDSIGLCEVGIIGWVSKRPIVDQFFLVSPGDIDSIGRHIYDKSFRDAQPTYIGESPLLFGTMRGHPWFWQDYEFVTSFPSRSRSPLDEKQAAIMRKSGQFEIDIWRHRDTKLSLPEANALSAQYRAQADAAKKSTS